AAAPEMGAGDHSGIDRCRAVKRKLERTNDRRSETETSRSYRRDYEASRHVYPEYRHGIADSDAAARNRAHSDSACPYERNLLAFVRRVGVRCAARPGTPKLVVRN